MATAALVLTLGLPVRPGASTLADGAVGKVKVSTGEVFVLRAGAREDARTGDPLLEHDIVQTGANGSVGVTLRDQTAFSAGPNSQVSIDSYLFEPATLNGKLLMGFKRGSLMIRSGDMNKQKPGSVQVKTPRSLITVRGTTLLVTIEEE